VQFIVFPNPLMSPLNTTNLTDTIHQFEDSDKAIFFFQFFKQLPPFPQFCILGFGVDKLKFSFVLLN